jgi:hypothetical protein
MTGLFYDGEVKSQRCSLETEHQGNLEQQVLWDQLNAVNPANATSRISELRNRASQINGELKKIGTYDSEMRKCYWLAGLFLVIGTVAQLNIAT